MPFQSSKQKRYLWANEPEVARKWADKYNEGGKIMNREQAKMALAEIARTQGKDAAMATVMRRAQMLSPEDMSEAMAIINMNCGGKVGYNMGGHIPRYNAGGGLLNHPYEREGEQFDTVPAMLTPGEFVVDADSTHKFGDELEKINNWEPGSGEGEAKLSKDEDVKIERKFKDGTKIVVHSPEGSETEISGLLSSLVDTAKEEHGLLPVKKMNRGGYVNMNLGGVLTQDSQPTVQEPGVLTPEQLPGVLTPEQQRTAQSQQLAGVGFSLLGNTAAGSQLAAMGNESLRKLEDGPLSQQIIKLLRQANPQLVGKPAKGGA